ncbi:hypothetical protein HanIR_Chr05g0240161 [Helianthus annuus]|nr:hypothetical protein HanIR_Chr05g0240161 [Helianthus annuus]
MTLLVLLISPLLSNFWLSRNMGCYGISVRSVRKLLAKILYFSNVINVIRIFHLMLWIGFSSDICKSDTSALVGFGCYNYVVLHSLHLQD